MLGPDPSAAEIMDYAMVDLVYDDCENLDDALCALHGANDAAMVSVEIGDERYSRVGRFVQHESADGSLETTEFDSLTDAQTRMSDLTITLAGDDS